MATRHHIESYKFWDVVALWAKEQLESEEVVARALAKGIIRDGLRVQSTDAQWVKAKAVELKGQPFVGFCAAPGAEMAVLRAQALEHLLAVVRQARRPSRTLLKEEFITKEDFAAGYAAPSNHYLPSGLAGAKVPSNSAFDRTTCRRRYASLRSTGAAGQRGR